ncbi:unnamed protein product [Absidia cylindrospora]
MDWQDFFRRQGITTWFDRHSSVPLRYLGFSMVQSPAQRHHISQQLLTTVSNACNIYSQRHLSIRGRTTIANMLILAKIWYQLRLVNLPQCFYTQLRSIIYQFITKGFKPSISYSSLCNPISAGGLGLLDAFSQTLVLQRRWLSLLVHCDSSSSFGANLLHHHLTMLPNNHTAHRLPLFYTSLRRGPLCTPGSVLGRIFRAMDQYPMSLDDIHLSPATWLRLPLSSIVSSAPSDHWINTNHASDPIHWFFRYDSNPGCLRPLLPPSIIRLHPPDVLRHRNLSMQLIQDLRSHTILVKDAFKQQLSTWGQPEDTPDDLPLISSFIKTPGWSRYTPRSHRSQLLLSLSSSTNMPNINNQLWKKFWIQPQHLHARTLWYRLILGKLYSQPSLAWIRPLSPASCLFCTGPLEDLPHLFVTCPLKWSIWLQAFEILLPDHSFSQDTILSCLLSLDFPHLPSITPTLWLTCGCMVQIIWRHHWQHVIHNVPLIPSLTSLFTQLRPSPHVYYLSSSPST